MYIPETWEDWVVNALHGLQVAAHPIVMGSALEIGMSELVRVIAERPSLTPAQQHAEELAELVREMSQPDFPGEVGAGSACGRARALLDKIKPPEPPTLAEALAALQEVMEKRENTESAIALLDRARRAGVL